MNRLNFWSWVWSITAIVTSFMYAFGYDFYIENDELVPISAAIISSIFHVGSCLSDQIKALNTEKQ